MATKAGIENLKCIQYKLCMMWILVDGGMHIYRNDMSVIDNNCEPEAMNRKVITEYAIVQCANMQGWESC